MNRQDLKASAEQIVRESLRENSVTGDYGAAEAAGGLLSAVQMDRAQLKACVLKALTGSGGNPLNALLGLFGLRIVSPKNAARDLDALLESPAAPALVEDTEGQLLGFFMLDGTAARQAMDRLSQGLHEAEESGRQATAAQQAAFNRQAAELDESREECAALRAEAARLRQTMAEQLQYLLGLAGPEHTKVGDRLEEMLDDLDLRAAWSAEDGPAPEAAMFTVMKCDDPEARRGKPCILSPYGVYVRGLRFIKG